MDFLFLDTETGGLDPATDALLTLGMIAGVDSSILDSIHIEIQPENYTCNQGALDVNHIDVAEHKRVAISRKDAAERITGFITKNLPESKPVVVGHNTGFDLGFLNELFSSTGLKPPYGYRNLDTAGNALFMKHLGIETGTNLPSLLRYYNIPFTDDILHNALTDAQLTREAYLAQVTHMHLLLGEKVFT